MISNQEDAYSTVIVDDLLRGVNDWRNIQDIVRLTFKALAEIVRAQGLSIRELERQMPSRVTRSEFQASLSQKADFAQVLDQISDLRGSLDNRSALIDLQASIDSKVSHTELSYCLSSKASVEDLTSFQSSSKKEFENALREVHTKTDSLQHTLNRHIQNVASINDIDILNNLIQKKANAEDLDVSVGQLEERIAASLAKKAGKYEIESALARKADSGDMQRVMAALESKAEQEWVEQIAQALDEKADIAELNHKYIPQLKEKASREEIDVIHNILQNLRNEHEEGLEHTMKDTSSQMQSMRKELDYLRTDLVSALAGKVEVKEIDKLVTSLSKKIDTDAMQDQFRRFKTEVQDSLTVKYGDLKNALEKKEEDLKSKLTAAESTMRQLSHDNEELTKHMSTISARPGGESLQRELAKLTGDAKEQMLSELQTLSQEVTRLFRRVDELSSLKSNKEEVSDLAHKLALRLDRKPDYEELDKAVHHASKDLTNAILQTKDDLRLKISALDNELTSKLEQKVSASDLHGHMGDKADSSMLTRMISTRATTEDVSNLRKEVDKLIIDARNKVPREDFDRHVGSTKGALENVGKDMMLKANVKDICALLDTKASVDDVNSALLDIHKELDGKAEQQEFADYRNEQLMVNDALCSETTVGRWIWKSGEVKNGYAVPWDVQSVNTCPDNFLWEPDCTSILVLVPGLYEVTFGFYSKKKPSVQLLVNGEAILSAVNNASYVIHHSSGRLKNVGPHHSGNIAGLTLIDFLALPTRSRVSISFTSDFKAEGFLGLRKL